MQIMEGDIIRTIQTNAAWLGHFHTGGVPGRHEIDETQELNYHAICEAIKGTGIPGVRGARIRADPAPDGVAAAGLRDLPRLTTFPPP